MMDINKFGALVEDVRGRIERKFDPTTDILFSGIFNYRKYSQIDQSKKSVLDRGKFNIALVLLFDYDELNDYAKIIVDKTQAFFLKDEEYEYKLDKKLTIGKYEIPEIFDEYKRKGFIEELLLLKENERNQPEFFRLIFWALMIMAVDKKTAAKKLQDICEYAKLFGFDEKSVLFIFKMINVVLGNKKAKKYNVDMIARMMFDNDFKNMELIGKLQGDLEDIFNHYQ